jgi:hypothetical protein
MAFARSRWAVVQWCRGDGALMDVDGETVYRGLPLPRRGHEGRGPPAPPPQMSARNLETTSR